MTASARRSRERLPLALSVSLQALVPICVLGILMSGFLFVRWRAEVQARAQAEAARATAEARVGRINLLLGQLVTQSSREVELEQLLDKLPANDPRRGAVEEQLTGVRAELAQTEKALTETAPAMYRSTPHP